MAAQLAAESSDCRSTIGREPRFLALLLRFVTLLAEGGSGSSGAGGRQAELGTEATAAAIVLLSRVSALELTRGRCPWLTAALPAASD